jgi:hypothetical protein
VGDGALVAETEAFAIVIDELRRNVWIAVLVAVVGVGAAMVFDVAAGTINTVMESALANLRETIRNVVPLSVLRYAIDLGDLLFVSAAEACTVLLGSVRRQMRIAIFVAIVGVGAAMIFNVLLRTDAAIFKSAAFEVIEGAILPDAAPTASNGRWWWRRSVINRRCRLGVIEVAYADLIAAAETVLIGFADIWRNTGVAKLVAILDVGLAMIFEVLAGAFDAIVKAALLKLIELARGSVPAILLGGGVRCSDAKTGG